MWQRRVFWTSWLLQVCNPCQAPACVNLATVACYRLSTYDFFVLFALCCSLIKMVYAIAAKSGQRPMWNQLEHAIRRNFGGLVEGEPVKIFKRRFQIADVSINKTLTRGKCFCERYLVLRSNWAETAGVDHEMHLYHHKKNIVAPRKKSTSILSV